MQLDLVDLAILKALQEDGRITNLALSRLVSLSPSACLARVQRLWRKGAIKRTVAILSPSHIGPALHCVMEATLVSHLLADHQKFETAIAEIAEITMAVKVSGSCDYLLGVTVADMPALNALSNRMLKGELGIAKLMTRVILDVVRPFQGFPVEDLVDRAVLPSDATRMARRSV